MLTRTRGHRHGHGHAHRYDLVNITYTEIRRKPALQTREYKHNEYNSCPING